MNQSNFGDRPQNDEIGFKAVSINLRKSCEYTYALLVKLNLQIHFGNYF